MDKALKPEKENHRNSTSTSPFLSGIITLIAWVAVVYQMVSTQKILQSSMEHQIIHLGFVILLIGLGTSASSASFAKKYSWIFISLIGLIAIGYIKIHYEHLEEVIGFPEFMDVVMGSILILVVIVITFQAWGLVFPCVVILALAYFFLGHFLPGPLFHHKIPFTSAISFLSIGFGSGIFGRFLALMADFGFLLIFFGSMLETMGANSFFLEMGKLGGKISQGGPAQTAVVGSSLVGMASGSAIANVIITGSFTIPTMKKFGYKPELAGAIEAVASSGSQIMPPIMGATAFLMAAFLGRPYSEIMIAGFIPALMYYIAVAINVELMARRYAIDARKENIDYRLLIERAFVFLIPLGFLTVLLILQKSPGYTSFYAILLVVGIGYLRKGTRPSFKKLTEGVVTGSIAAAKISIVVATVAMIAQIVITTGLGTKLAYIVGLISGGNLAMTLILTMVLCIILGCGVPSSAAYALVAILIVPSIVNMGIAPLQIHFFCLYFAIISAITPPVALASLGASAIAQSNYAKTGWEAFKLGLTGFIIPFFIVFNPAFLLKSEGFFHMLTSFLSALLVIFFISITTYGYLFFKLPWYMRVLTALGAIFTSAYVITLKPVLFFIGIFFGLGSIVWQVHEYRTGRSKEYQKLITPQETV